MPRRRRSKQTAQKLGLARLSAGARAAAGSGRVSARAGAGRHGGSGVRPDHSANVIDIAPLRIVNVHGSLLPKYRGAGPVQWAIVNGETTTGVTTMRIDAGLIPATCC